MDDTSAAYGIDGPAFLLRVEGHLTPIAPIMAFVVKKQMSDLSVSADTITPAVARQFIDRVVAVLRTFAPPPRVEEIRQALLREFRKAAPQFAEQMLYGGRA